MSKPILRYTALLEGVSWLALLFIAMPIKYFGGNPIPVKYFGMGHGVLFVLLVMLIMDALSKEMIDKKLGATLFVASFIPFGTLFTDKKLK
jgi:integral membrane protein